MGDAPRRCEVFQSVMLLGIFLVHLIFSISILRHETFLTDVTNTLHNVRQITDDFSRPETQQLVTSALTHSNHLMGVIHEKSPEWSSALNRTMFNLANVLQDLHEHPEWFETLTGELPKVTHESEEWRHSIISSLKSFLTSEPPNGG